MTEPTPESTQPPADESIWRRPVWPAVRRILRAKVTAGLIFVLPIWITFLLLRFIFEAMRDMSLWFVVQYLDSPFGKGLVEKWHVPAAVLKEKGLSALPGGWQWAIGIFCVMLTITFLYIVGIFTANFFGRRLIKAIENLVNRLPLVKTVYRASKQILESFTGESSKEFQRVALIPYPSMEVRSIGFITAITKDTNTGEELCTVFLATTPNPTTGYVFVMRRADVIELDWDIEDTISVIMSGGALVPDRVPLIRAAPSEQQSVPGAIEVKASKLR